MVSFEIGMTCSVRDRNQVWISLKNSVSHHPLLRCGCFFYRFVLLRAHQRTTFLYFLLTNVTLSLKKLSSLSWTNTRTRLPRAVIYAKNESTKERETTFLAEFWREWDGDPSFDQFLFLLSAFLYFSFAIARGNLQLLVCCFHSGFRRHESV